MFGILLIAQLNTAPVNPSFSQTEKQQQAIVLPVSYYVDAIAGDDTNSGLSPGKAWRSISRVNTHAFHPGDRIHFKRSQIWRDTLILSSSGIRGSPITVSAYGDGQRPVISGAEVLENWATTSVAGVFSAFLIHKTNQLFADGKRLTYKPWNGSLQNTSLDQGHWTQEPSTNGVYLHTLDDTPPTSQRIEVSVRDTAVHGNAQNYIVVEKLNLQKARQTGLNTKSGDHWKIHQVVASSNAITNLKADKSTNVYFFKNSVFDGGNGIAGHETNHLHIESNYSGYNNGSVDNDGINVSNSTNVLIEKNRVESQVYGDSADGIQCSGCDAIVRDNTVINPFELGNAGIILTTSTQTSRGDITNNQVVGFKLGIKLTTNTGTTTVSKNIVVNSQEAAIKIDASYNVPVEIRSNVAVAFGNGNAVSLSVKGQEGDPKMLHITAANNCYLSTTSTLIKWHLNHYDSLESYQSVSGQDSSSIVADPKFLWQDGKLTIEDSSQCHQSLNW